MVITSCRMSSMSIGGAHAPATSSPSTPQLDAVGPLGSTALIMATTQGNIDLVQSLLDARASVDLEGLEFNDDVLSEKKVSCF